LLFIFSGPIHAIFYRGVFMRKFIIYLIICMHSFSGIAQSSTSRVSADPDLNYAVVDVNGKSHLVDGNINKVIVSDGAGNLYSFSFQDVAHNIANGNAIDAAGLSAELDSALSDRSLIFTLTNQNTTRIATQDYFNDTSKGGNDFNEVQKAKKKQILSTSSTTVYPKQDGAGSGLSGPCDFSPCTPIIRTSDGRVIYIRNSWSSVIGTQNTIQQTYYANDYKEWQRAKSSVCNAAIDAAEDTTIAGLAASASCPYSLSGPGALACAASVGSVLILNQRLARYNKACSSSYPGPGRW
jgi:hypothetical protein